jgi:hypothetical protein
MKDGDYGMSSCSRVGRVLNESAMDRKSAAASRTCCVMRTRFRSACFRESSSAEKRPRAPGNASDIDRNSSNNRYQSCCAKRFRGCCRISSSSYSRASRCGGKLIVAAWVSRSQPSILFRVDQHASPFSIFFTDAGSLRYGGSAGSNGRRMSSMEYKTSHGRRCLLCSVWANKRKSST